MFQTVISVNCAQSQTVLRQTVPCVTCTMYVVLVNLMTVCQTSTSKKYAQVVHACEVLTRSSVVYAKQDAKLGCELHTRLAEIHVACW